MIKAITPAQLHKRRHEVFLLDIREGRQHIKRPIRGAMWMPNHELAKSWGVLPRDQEIIVFDQTTGHASKAAAFLQKMGLKASYLQGGAMAWKQERPYKTNLLHH